MGSETIETFGRFGLPNAHTAIQWKWGWFGSVKELVWEKSKRNIRRDEFKTWSSKENTTNVGRFEDTG